MTVPTWWELLDLDWEAEQIILGLDDDRWTEELDREDEEGR